MNYDCPSRSFVRLQKKCVGASRIIFCQERHFAQRLLPASGLPRVNEVKFKRGVTCRDANTARKPAEALIRLVNLWCESAAVRTQRKCAVAKAAGHSVAQPAPAQQDPKAHCTSRQTSRTNPFIFLPFLNRII